ncbi:MAG: hypothetical protein JWR01_1259 [Subtercola sp.]|nr:hypothetical protein [Subtercola sp.]
MSSTATRPGDREHRSPETGAYSVGVAVVRPRPVRGEPVGWFRRAPARLFGGEGRMIGVDVARGLAVVGLLCGVLVPGLGVGAGGAVDVGGSLWLVTTALFVLVAGLSTSRLMTGSPGGPLRVAVRAGVLFALGAIAIAIAGAGGAAAADGARLASGIAQPAVMLQLLGALTFLALFLRARRARSLFAIAGACLLVLPACNAAMILWATSQNGAGGQNPFGALREVVLLVAPGAFPVLTWCAPFLAGLAVGRMTQGRLWRPFALLAAGGACFALSVGGSFLVDRSFDPGSRGHAILGSVLTAVPAKVAGSLGSLDILGATSVALTLVALCLLLARPLRWLVLPLASLGSLALTASTALCAALLLAPRAVDAGWSFLTSRTSVISAEFGAALALIAVLAAAALTATLWRALLGSGPMERVVALAGTLSARAPFEAAADESDEAHEAAAAPQPLRRTSFTPEAAAPETVVATAAAGAMATTAAAAAAEFSVPAEPPRLPETPPAAAPEPRVRFSLKQPPPEARAPARDDSADRADRGAASTPRRPPNQKPGIPGRTPAPGRPKRSRGRSPVPPPEPHDVRATVPAVPGPSALPPVGTRPAAPDPTGPPSTRWNPGQSLGRLPY